MTDPNIPSGTPKHSQENKASQQDELINNLQNLPNPYPMGHICAKLYELTSPENKITMRNNIKINTEGNIEVLDREYKVLRATANEKTIKEKNGIIYFCDGSYIEEAKKQGYSLFDTQEEAKIFINAFVGKNNTLNNKIGNMMRIFGIYKAGEVNGYRDAFDNKRRGLEQGYAILTKPIIEKNKSTHNEKYEDDDEKDIYGVKCFISAEKKEFFSSLLMFDSHNGYPIIVSRPIEKT